MAALNTSPAEAEEALHRLLDRHHAWMVAQPEMLLLWTQGRDTRKRVARILADEMTTIPYRSMNENTPPNRAMRRRILEEVRKLEGAQWYQEGMDYLNGGLPGGIVSHDSPGTEEGPAPAVPEADEA